MPRKPKTYGPILDAGVEIKIVAPKKSALSKLQSDFTGDSRLVENLLSISPVQFAGVEDAENFIYEAASSWEGKACPYVTIRDLSQIKTPKITELKGRLKREEGLLSELKKKTDVTSQKAKLITCRNCESKINKAWIKESRCPVCETTLRSPTATIQIENKEKKIEKIKAELIKEQQKRAGDAPLRYLVLLPKA